MSVIILLVALALFGRDALPRIARAEPVEASSLRVFSFNALARNASYAEVTERIRAADADLVAVQELSPGMADAISAALGDLYPYSALHPWRDPRGIGLWSRYPMREEETFTLELWENWGQHVVIEVDGQTLHVINVHLWPIGTLDRRQFARSLARQHVQAAELHSQAQQFDEPLLVVGDFNASPTNETYSTVSESLNDVWREAGSGPGFTWPAPGTISDWVRPFLRIDYMWVRGPVTPLEIQIMPAIPGSDHLPLVADFTLSASP
jgi:vancomycin resistance protein VanJ